MVMSPMRRSTAVSSPRMPRRGRNEVLAEARSEADQMLEAAHGEATRAAEAAAGPSPLSNGEWRDRTSERAYLRTFSEVYRSHLRSYLETLLSNVKEWEQAEKSSPAAVRAALPIPPVVVKSVLAVASLRLSPLVPVPAAVAHVPLGGDGRITAGWALFESSCAG
jgi:hypothetical protein